MPRRDFALDTDPVANGIGNALVAPSPHPRHVKLGKTMQSHLASLPGAAGSLQDPAVAHGLTPREAHVLRLLADGLSNQAIAVRLGLAPKTVRNQVSTILTKLGVHTRAAAAERARTAGL